MKKIYNNNYISLLVFLLLVFSGFSAKATVYPFHNIYSGAQENPPNASTAKGAIVGWYNDETNTISFTIIFSGLSANVTGAHFHAPAPPGANAPIIIPFTTFPLGVTQGIYSNSFVITDAQEAQLFAGLWYANIHTSAIPGGEIRTQMNLSNPGTIYIFDNVMTGAQENPPNSSTAVGRTIGSFNPATKALTWALNYTGLSAPASAGHFHAPAPPGTNAPVIIPFSPLPNATSGTYFGNVNLTPTQETWFLGNLFYSNVHNPVFPGGEIRAQITPNIPPTIACPANITMSNTTGQCSRSVSFAATTTGNPAPAVTYKIGSTTITSPNTFPVGTSTVTATAVNAAGTATCSFMVTINDTEAPTIMNLGATPNALWSPNHKMVDVTVNYSTTDNCPGPITNRLTITSNEAVNANGSGNTSPDWVVVDDHHVKLRAERSGKGNGRTYTIILTSTDQYGNSSTNTTTVGVAHDNSITRKEMNNELMMPDGFGLKVLSNPTSSDFVLNIQGNKMNLQIIDISGRIVETRNISGSQLLRVGSKLRAGVYMLKLTQGSEMLQAKLVKIQ